MGYGIGISYLVWWARQRRDVTDICRYDLEHAPSCLNDIDLYYDA